MVVKMQTLLPLQTQDSPGHLAPRSAIGWEGDRVLVGEGWGGRNGGI